MVTLNEQDDLVLVNMTKDGQLHAYSILVRRYETSIRACLRVRLSNIHEAEDLAQETFILAYDKLAQFQTDASFGAWLRGIAINLLRNHQRKHSPISVGGNVELEKLIDQQIEYDYQQEPESDLMTQLKYCLNKLDDKMRTLLTEHFALGYSLAELCNKYDDRHSTMTMRMYRLRQKLKNCVENKVKG